MRQVFYFIWPVQTEAPGILFYIPPIKRVTRTFKTDARVPENQRINFKWPKQNKLRRLGYMGHECEK